MFLAKIWWIGLTNLPPLIVWVDIPDATLYKDLVLIHGQQHAQGEWGDFLNEDGVAGAVTFETLKHKRRLVEYREGSNTEHLNTKHLKIWYNFLLHSVNLFLLPCVTWSCQFLPETFQSFSVQLQPDQSSCLSSRLRFEQGNCRGAAKNIMRIAYKYGTFKYDVTQ